MHKGQHVIGEPPPTMPDPPPPLPRGQSIDIGGHVGIVRPGDTLIIATSCQLTQADADRILDRLVHQLPGVKAVLIPQTSTLAIYRPETT